MDPSSNTMSSGLPSHQVRASDVLVDGFIAQTFTPQDAYNFLVLSLKTPDFLGYYRLSYIQGVWCITQNAPYLPPPSPGIPIQHPQIPLDFNVTETQGTVVPQRRWFPADPVDFRRHVIDANLMLPVFFMNRNGGIGFWLPDILQGRDRDLHNGDSEAPLGGRTTTHIRINWPGYDFFRRQIPIRDETYARNPITLARFMKHVGTSVDKFFNSVPNGPVDDPRWRIGMHGITQSHIKIIGAVHVSAGSWMPIMQLTGWPKDL